MVDISKALQSKSDQINAIDLIEPLVIKITSVDVDPTRQQKVWIYYEGDEKRPYKPSVGMCRFIAKAWGLDSDNYIGKSMELFNEPSVVWAGKEAGGIRISHMSDIKKAFTLPLRISRTKSIPYTVKPLEVKEEIKLSERQEAVKITLGEIKKTFKDFSKLTKEVIERHEEDLSKVTDEECEMILNYLETI